MLIMLYSKVTELVYGSLSTQKRISIRSKGEKVLVSIRETGWCSSDLSHREVLPILRLIYMVYLYIYKFGYQEEKHGHSRLINRCSTHRYSRKCDSSKGNNNLMSLLMLMEASERSQQYQHSNHSIVPAGHGNTPALISHKPLHVDHGTLCKSHLWWGIVVLTDLLGFHRGKQIYS